MGFHGIQIHTARSENGFGPACGQFVAVRCRPGRTVGGSPGSSIPLCGPRDRPPSPADAALEARIGKLLGEMTLEQKVGQLIQADIASITPDDLRHYPLGSILNGGSSSPGNNEFAPPSEWLALADRFYDASMDPSHGPHPIPTMWGTDAVHGHNNIVGATIFPHNIGLGAARDPELIRQIGEVTAREVRATGHRVDIRAHPRRRPRRSLGSNLRELLGRSADRARIRGPDGIWACRASRARRNFSTQPTSSPPPSTSWATAAPAVATRATTARAKSSCVTSILPAIRPRCAAGVQTVMASFSSWQGVKMHGNRDLLTDVLKQRLHFDGLVVGDWNGHGQVPGCTNVSCAAAINAGIDMHHGAGQLESSCMPTRSRRSARERFRWRGSKMRTAASCA